MLLSVVIASHSDGDLPNTLESLRATAPDVEIVVVDDSSVRPVASEHARVIRTARRIGVGPARTLGALHATGDYLLFTDAHCRFSPGWLEAALPRIVGRNRTLHCGMCLGLDSLHMDLSKPNGRYYGGTINVLGPDRNARSKTQVFESVWNQHPPADDEEILCCLGACYFMPKAWFLELSPLEHLRGWGEDEIMLSVKTWRSGGDVRFLPSVQVGHKFRLPKERIPYPIPFEDSFRNKAFAVVTLTEPPLTDVLLKALRRQVGFSTGWRALEADWAIVEVERAKNRAAFVRSFEELAAKFPIPLPGLR